MVALRNLIVTSHVRFLSPNRGSTPLLSTVLPSGEKLQEQMQPWPVYPVAMLEDAMNFECCRAKGPQLRAHACSQDARAGAGRKIARNLRCAEGLPWRWSTISGCDRE